jgi:hypothetical protein
LDFLPRPHVDGDAAPAELGGLRLLLIPPFVSVEDLQCTIGVLQAINVTQDEGSRSGSLNGARIRTDVEENSRQSSAPD